MNMSYCRFRNTSLDLDDCHAALENLISGDEETGALSLDELNAAKRLVQSCIDIAQLFVEHAGKEFDDLTGRDIAAVLNSAQKAAEDQE